MNRLQNGEAWVVLGVVGSADSRTGGTPRVLGMGASAEAAAAAVPDRIGDRNLPERETRVTAFFSRIVPASVADAISRGNTCPIKLGIWGRSEHGAHMSMHDRAIAGA